MLAALAIGVSAAALAHPGQAGGGMGMQGKAGMQHGMHGAGQQLMTPEERSALVEKMRNATTPEERRKLAEATRAEMQKRAREKGITPDMRGMGPGMMMQGMQHNGPMAGMHSGDAAFQADMQLVHEMLQGHDKIKRTVENLPDGIRTVTESDDPNVATALKAHVASMEQRLKDGRIFNLFSPTLPVLFDHKDKIRTEVRMTEKGAVVTQTSADAKVVAALQAHASEVDELARDGMAAMMRGMRSRMMGAAR
jgi:hypothetical protein